MTIYHANPTKSKNINSKQLYNFIVGTLNEVADDMIVVVHMGAHSIMDYDQLVEFTELFMEELADRKSITTWEVICDHRNNPGIIQINNRINMRVEYKQFNCLNVSSIDFVIEPK